MEWREAGGVEWVEARLPGARAAFSTRSAGDMKASHERIAATLGLDAERIAVSHQVHGAEVAYDAAGEGGLEVDGHVVTQSGAAALVKVADCLPVALAGPAGAAILHCGWRGLAAGIVAEGVGAVGATHAAVGPGIGPCCYEVGAEVLDAFAPLGEAVARRRMLDLAEVARRLLHEAGVEEIESADLCTRCEAERFFSHRRDGDPRRQAGLVWLDRGGI